MRTSIATVMMTAVLGAIAVPALQADTGHDHDNQAPVEATSHDNSHEAHYHGTLEISEGQPVPTVVVDVFSDPVSGWNLRVQTENWEFAPQRVNESSEITEGHAHLYLNGEKLTRVYGEWHHIPSLPPGEHTLTVGLTANRHETLMYSGEPIEASVKVVVPEVELAL